MLKWIKDQKVENKLRSLGVKFEIEQIPFAKIDRDEGIRRQARMIGKLDENNVVNLAIAMGLPDAAFPMVVLNKPRSGNLWAWSGNHRLGGFQLAFTEEECKNAILDAYVTQVNEPVMQDFLPRVLNTVETSLPFTREERIFHARYMCTKHGVTTQEAAAAFGIKPEWITISNRVEEARQIVAEVLGEKSNGFSASALKFLHTLSDDVNIVKETAKVLHRHEVKGKDLEHLIADVKAKPTHLDKMAELARWEKVLDAPKRASKKGKPVFQLNMRERFLTALVRLSKILSTADSLSKVQCLEAADIATVCKLWGEIEGPMKKMVREGVKG